MLERVTFRETREFFNERRDVGEKQEALWYRLKDKWTTQEDKEHENEVNMLKSMLQRKNNE